MTGVDSPAPALGGLRVLDLTAEAGSLAPRLLGGLGAEVLRIEPLGGHSDRRRPPFADDIPDPERSLIWLQFNAGKKSVTLNLESEDGRFVYRRLVGVSDVVVESLPAGYLDSLGLGYAALARERPDLVQLSISPFGEGGPYAGYVGSDLTEMAMGGLMYLCGDPDLAPVRVTAEQAYAQAGIQGAVAALVALWRRDETGLGAQIDFSIQEAMLWTLGNNRLTHSAGGPVTRRAGGGRADLSGGNRIIYRAADGYIGFLRRSDGHIALHHWLDDEGVETGMIVADLQGRPLYGPGSAAPELRARLEEVLRQFFEARPKRQLVQEGQRRNLIIAEVASPADLLASEHLRERGFFQTVHQPALGRDITVLGAPYRSADMPWTNGNAPRIGEHNLEIYEGLLGFSRSDVITLRAVGGV